MKLLASLSLMFLTFSLYAQKPYCVEVVSEIAIDDNSKLGFSGADLLKVASFEKKLDWHWGHKEDQTFLNLVAESNKTLARYVESTAVYPEGFLGQEIICADRIEVDAWISFFTADGSLDERWFTTLYDTDGTDCVFDCAAVGDEANFVKLFWPQGIKGSFYNELNLPAHTSTLFYAQGVFTQHYAQSRINGITKHCSDTHCHYYLINGGSSY